MLSSMRWLPSTTIFLMTGSTTPCAVAAVERAPQTTASATSNPSNLFIRSRPAAGNTVTAIHWGKLSSGHKLCQVIPGCKQQQAPDKTKTNPKSNLLGTLPQRTPTNSFYCIIQDVSPVEHRDRKKIE